MIAFKKIFSKKVLRNILITLLAYCLLSFGLTVVIYDLTFPRCDTAAESALPEYSEEIRFMSGENKLCGYLYGSGGRALVIIVPGYFAGAAEYSAQIKSFRDHGFGVFVFDTTGCRQSEGDSSVGFPQTVLDLDAAIAHIEQNNRFGYEDLLLFGHSRGGYAACLALKGEHDITAVVSVGGANSAMEAVNQKASEYVGFLAYGNYPMLWVYQAMLFGSEAASLQADEVISESDIPVLIVQGVNDTTSPIDSCSIYSHRDDIKSPLVEYILCETPGQDGHTDLLFDGNGNANPVLMERINGFYDRCLG